MALYIPSEVLADIDQHVKAAITHAEVGYVNGQEEEDTLTGDLCGALRTSTPRKVLVQRSEVNGVWTWSMAYAKFRGRGGGATESVVGADGILDVRLSNGLSESQKAVLFQAKNEKSRDPKLPEQCIRMSTWREAAAVFEYTPVGYWALPIDDAIVLRRTDAASGVRVRLRDWIVSEFLACKVGHTDLTYDRVQRRLAWQSGDGWVYADFMPKHHVRIAISGPTPGPANAAPITVPNIASYRLDVTPREMFGFRGDFTLAQLKKRRRRLLRSYHPDQNHGLPADLRAMLDRRVIEINSAYEALLSLGHESTTRVRAKAPNEHGEAIPTDNQVEVQMPRREAVRRRKREPK